MLLDSIPEILGNEITFKADLTVDIEVSSKMWESVDVFIGFEVYVYTAHGCILSHSCIVPTKGVTDFQSEEFLAIIQKCAKTTVQNLSDDVACGACVDRYVADQLAIYLALAGGTSSIKVPTPREDDRHLQSKKNLKNISGT